MTLLGLDLSLTASAVVAVPLDWDGNWSRVRSCVTGEKLERSASDAERAHRTERIAARLVSFARSVGATHAFVEGYAYGLRTSAHSLGELGGVVRLALVTAGLELATVNMGTARKLLLGVCPRSSAKVAVAETLRAAGAPRAWSLDESDAFAVANFGLSELGGYCFAQVAA
jgi:Holliday junction resolvasome RuvABC endonuclease subunit